MTKIFANRSDTDLDYPNCRPSLDLDFTQEQLDSRITFTRGSNATRINKKGFIEVVSNNQPRFDYDPITRECKGLLLEESRINYFPYTTAYYGGTVTDGTVTGADGNVAKKFVPTKGNASYPAIGGATDYSFSLATGESVDVSFSGYFADIADGLYVPDIVIQANSTTGSPYYTYSELCADLTTGAPRSYYTGDSFSTLIPPKFTLMPFGMYKITWTVRYTQGALYPRNLLSFYVQCRKKNEFGTQTGEYYADGVNGFQYSCIQYEIGSFPTSYIYTDSTPKTRSQDLASMEGTNFSSWYNTREGTFIVNNISRVSGSTNYIEQNNSMFSVSNPDKSSQINAWYNYYGAALVEIDTNSIAAFIPVSNVPAGRNNIPIRQSVSYKNLDFNVVTNGTICTNDFSSQVPDLLPTDFSRLLIGYGEFYTGPLNGTISRLTYYPKKLKTNQLVLLTS